MNKQTMESHLLVFTDLDGTLLEHDSYTWDAARTALVQLEARQIPVIPVSSKTLAELDDLRQAIGFDGPMVAESGCVIMYPGEKPGIAPPGYAAICEFLHRLRNELGFRFTGFSDMTAETVAESTGLSVDASRLAMNRLASEPLLWQDTPEKLASFRKLATESNLVVLQGGRFLHLLGNTDKGQALQTVCHWYSKRGMQEIRTVALGDSDNDRQMLVAADIPIVVRKKDGSHLDLQERPDAIYTDKPGPAGWNEAILSLLNMHKIQETS